MITRICIILSSILLVAAGCSHLAGEDKPATILGDPVRGEEIFRVGLANTPPCSTCHRVAKGGLGFALGPNLEGLSERAIKRVEGLSVQQYIEDSILNPRTYVVSGYRVSMYEDYAEHLSQQDIADLVAYLLSL